MFTGCLRIIQLSVQILQIYINTVQIHLFSHSILYDYFSNIPQAFGTFDILVYQIKLFGGSLTECIKSGNFKRDFLAGFFNAQAAQFFRLFGQFESCECCLVIQNLTDAQRGVRVVLTSHLYGNRFTRLPQKLTRKYSCRQRDIVGKASVEIYFRKQRRPRLFFLVLALFLINARCFHINVVFNSHPHALLQRQFSSFAFLRKARLNSQYHHCK